MSMFAIHSRILTLGLWLLLIAARASASDSLPTTALVSRVDLAPMPERVADMASAIGELYLVDAVGHRILVVQDGVLRRIIGQIGNGPGELFYPRELAISDEGFLVVHDTGNQRIQTLEISGRFVAEFGNRGTWGLSTTGDRIYLGNPSRESLVDVVSLDGEKVMSLGVPISAQDLVSESVLKAREEAYSRALNRANIITDNDGTVWLAFLHRAIIQRYSVDGELLSETSIDIPGLDLLERSVLEPGFRPANVGSINIDGVQLTVIFRELAFDSREERIIVLTGDDRILILDLAGELLDVISIENLDSPMIAVAPLPRREGLAIATHTTPLFELAR